MQPFMPSQYGEGVRKINIGQFKKGAYTELFGISPELTQICYINHAVAITN